NPQAYAQLVPRFTAEYERTHPPAAAPFWEKHLDAKSVEKAWARVPKESELRKMAHESEIEAYAVSKGVQPYGDKTAGEVLIAYLNAASAVDATGVEYRELSQALRGKHGDETQLRTALAEVARIRGVEEVNAHRDAREAETK